MGKHRLFASLPGWRELRCNRKNISNGLKMAVTLLNYPATQGIPIEFIDTHLLRSGSANALVLPGYSDTQIQKIGEGGKEQCSSSTSGRN